MRTSRRSFAHFLGAVALVSLGGSCASIDRRPILLEAIATVAAFSILIFREPFHWTTGAGIVLVIAGVALITVHAG